MEAGGICGICHIRASNIIHKTHKSAKEGVDTHFK